MAGEKLSERMRKAARDLRSDGSEGLLLIYAEDAAALERALDEARRERAEYCPNTEDNQHRWEDEDRAGHFLITICYQCGDKRILAVAKDAEKETLRAQLAAAQQVVEAARVWSNASDDIEQVEHDLCMALAAYDAARAAQEPKG